ncbi:MAG: thiamine phosphate synthase [Rhodospirillaceae bacterium]|nr:thiamine phosphate synthase [Rhodospirillaceae bacterium]|tara:strand:- start:2659 stop:3330 length:672 start_codon:yes stop_codon:yes gene_type:complete
MTDGIEPLRCRLYLITPPEFSDSSLKLFSETLGSALFGGDVACLQIRLKDVPDDLVLEALDRLSPICHEHDVAIIINDQPELVLKSGCDGVHLGQTDTPYSEARAILGDDAIIGITCHNSPHLAMEAGEAGADYVAFGAFFHSNTKTRKFTADPKLLSNWQESMLVPCVAIGGITVENCQPIVKAGADFIAVSAGVWNHQESPAAAIRQFNDIFDNLVKAGNI